MDETRPTVLVDTREQDPLPLTGPWERGTLTTGDYSYRGGECLFCIERKSLADLVGSLTTERARFTRECERLRGYPFSRLLIIGNRHDLESGSYRSNATPLAMVNSLHAFEARYVPVVWAPSPSAGAALVERWAYWHAREIVRAAERITTTAVA
jgi:ERCC4-type nuclease